ncbi:hypothetical protein J6590_021107 [Homalodisca vitripennis]|nr:hypothetical protein J6590_021107 [Homalodisca vitripennis]
MLVTLHYSTTSNSPLASLEEEIQIQEWNDVRFRCTTSIHRSRTSVLAEVQIKKWDATGMTSYSDAPPASVIAEVEIKEWNATGLTSYSDIPPAFVVAEVEIKEWNATGLTFNPSVSSHGSHKLIAFYDLKRGEGRACPPCRPLLPLALSRMHNL